jgi:hypothetical protein
MPKFSANLNNKALTIEILSRHSQKSAGSPFLKGTKTPREKGFSDLL